jgi:hypothetical protein
VVVISCALTRWQVERTGRDGYLPGNPPGFDANLWAELATKTSIDSPEAAAVMAGTKALRATGVRRRVLPERRRVRHTSASPTDAPTPACGRLEEARDTRQIRRLKSWPPRLRPASRWSSAKRSRLEEFAQRMAE